MTRVLVYSSLRLVCESIMSLLAGSQDVEVMSCGSSVDEVLLQARTGEPDVVILGSEETADAPSPLVLRLWQEGCRAKVIELGLKGRVMSTYQMSKFTVTDATDLVEAIGLPPRGDVSAELV